MIGCSSENPVLQESSNDLVLEQYKARQDEVVRVDLGALAKITENILALEPNLTEQELRARIFKELVRLKESGEEEVLAGPYIAGYDYRLTWAEFWLLLRRPWYIWSTNKASNDALAEARRQWPRMDQRDTKADAFRHCYWNILLCKRVNEWWARTFTTAHESEESNVNSKEMDLHNNNVGRYIYRNNKSKSESSLSRKVKNYSYKRMYLTYRNTNTRYLVYMK